MNIASSKSPGEMATAAVGATAVDDMQRESSATDAGSCSSRRKELWSVLGDLPWTHRPAAPRLVRTEKHDGYTLERLVLDLNGEEELPALVLIPEKRQTRAPGMLYIHWHGGMYDLGKEQLLTGVSVQPAYAPVLAEKGIVTLAIDSWCFGERKRVADGRTGEEDALDVYKRQLQPPTRRDAQPAKTLHAPRISWDAPLHTDRPQCALVAHTSTTCLAY